MNYKHSRISSTKHIIFLSILIASVFVFLRVYNLESSLLFYGDMGRDFLEMQEWEQTYIPPLLGPQTSALPINQSPWYFYILMPFYVLTGKSLYSTNIALIAIHLMVFAGGIYILRNQKKLLYPLLAISWLIAIHPQFVIQQRYVWNPSFIGLFAVAVLLLLKSSLSKVSKVNTICLGILLAAMIAFSYASTPLVLAVLVAYMMLIPQGSISLIWYTLLSGVVLYSPTIVFEIRHNFLLTNSLLFGQRVLFEGVDVKTKIDKLITLTTDNNPLLGALFLLIIVHALRSKKHDRYLYVLMVVFTLTILLTLLAPFPIHNHYIFPMLSLMFVLIAYVPKKHLALSMIVLSIMWLKPSNIQVYSQSTPRTIPQTVSCIQSFCEKFPADYYLSTQASFHAQHDAKEFEYLFNEYGCRGTDMTLPKFDTQKMAVIADDAIYEHGKTSYNELTLFGESELEFTHVCQENLKIHVLKRI